MTLMTISCVTKKDDTQVIISDFFDTNFKYECVDSISGKIVMSVLNNQLDLESMSFKIVVPDSFIYADFYNAYINRIIEAYYINSNNNRAQIDSLLTRKDLDIMKVKTDIKNYFIDDDVFYNVFKNALSAYYGNIQNEENPEIQIVEKLKVPMDTLVQLALQQYDIVNYDSKRGFSYHEVCGVNPYSYSPDNEVNLLLPGFCQEALRTKKMHEAHSKIMHELSSEFKSNENLAEDNIKELCIKYQTKLRAKLLEERTLKKSLLEYYDKRKNIEPFEIVDINT